MHRLIARIARATYLSTIARWQREMASVGRMRRLTLALTDNTRRRRTLGPVVEPRMRSPDIRCAGRCSPASQVPTATATSGMANTWAQHGGRSAPCLNARRAYIDPKPLLCVWLQAAFRGARSRVEPGLQFTFRLNERPNADHSGTPIVARWRRRGYGSTRAKIAFIVSYEGRLTLIRRTKRR
jgi:hypothetical protein